MQESNAANNRNAVTSTAINGEIRNGDWVIAIPSGPYGGFVGVVKEITPHGSPEHGTDNIGDDIHVDFMALGHPPWRYGEIEDYFNEEFNYDDTLLYDELPIDDVIMAPDMLIRVTELGIEEVSHLLSDYDSAIAFCDNFTQYNIDSMKYVRLTERLNENLTEYHDQLMDFGPRELIDMAGKISAMSDVHSYMTMHHDFTDEELDFYIQFQNPLEVVANEWHMNSEDISGLSYVLQRLQSDADALTDYPLMNDLDPATPLLLNRYMNIDLELYLGKIAEKVIVYHPKDWEIDKQTLRKAALSDNPEEKRLFWHVCGFGTHLCVERDTFIRDTSAFNTMTNYRPNDPDMFGYAVEVTGMSGGIVKGNVFEVGVYADFAKRIRDTAEPLESLTLIYSNDWGVNAGKAVSVSRKEYDNDRHRLMSESGDVVEQVYHPQDKVRLAGLISKERSKRMGFPIASPGTLLSRMANRLAEARKPIEQPEQQADTSVSSKKPSLADKLQAAGEKAKNQDTHNNNNPSQKREER